MCVIKQFKIMHLYPIKIIKSLPENARKIERKISACSVVLQEK